MQEAKSDVIECGGICCSASSLDLMQDHRVYRSLAMAKITRVTLRHGTLARHPIAQIIFAIALGLIGLLGLVFVAADARAARGIGSIAIFGLLGIWLFIDALRTGHYLLIDLGTKKDRCAFSNDATREDIATFLLDASQTFSLPVEFDVATLKK